MVTVTEEEAALDRHKGHWKRLCCLAGIQLLGAVIKKPNLCIVGFFSINALRFIQSSFVASNLDRQITV